MQGDADIHAGWDGLKHLPIAVVIGHMGSANDASQRDAREWQVMGIVAGERFASDAVTSRQMRSGPDGDLYLWTGFRLRLHPDHCQDYAYNLQAERPGVYVVTRRVAGGGLRPMHTTVSLDEAQNLDATDLRSPDESVVTVQMPPEVYRWVEHFILDNHVHVPRKNKGRGKQRSKALFDAEVGDWAGEGE